MRARRSLSDRSSHVFSNINYQKHGTHNLHFDSITGNTVSFGQRKSTARTRLSPYVTCLIKLVNQKGRLKSSLIFDEFPAIYLGGMYSLIATARSNKAATALGIQGASQLRKDYGKERADVIMNIMGNVISGKVTCDTAKQAQ
ncbi:type IV secretory system conjugative DNA transfer family protein [Dyadobacter sp. LHD-138]|uniref:type IV secretory system conjugative DNA transfer family protein n=1 Tax=Dyadobacter sp. LHD-138 TaxID=3071413 RepID=UPI0027E04F7E|nr:type IV secretory system conjugative DNA transfer family protein [Dyadobacter sp. LHD-138]MDQ6482406.1 type IV secretory system conjugative DNA transfer family protein [Dyadobacter sp. LHD-138]